MRDEERIRGDERTNAETLWRIRDEYGWNFPSFLPFSALRGGVEEGVEEEEIDEDGRTLGQKR